MGATVNCAGHITGAFKACLPAAMQQHYNGWTKFNKVQKRDFINICRHIAIFVKNGKQNGHFASVSSRF
jgi:hypothetical protein